MHPDRKVSLTLAALTVAFGALAVGLWRSPAQPAWVARPPIVSPDSLAGVTPPGTIRISAAQLASSGGDASVLQCYACHTKDSPPEVKYDSAHRIILPKEHADLIIAMRNCGECHPADKPVKLDYDADGNVIVPEAHRNLTAMNHGNFRNENCFTCHERNQLDRLHTPDGTELTFDQAMLLCAGCHGPTYRDWQAGIHGRTSGYWLRSAGPFVRQQCPSCHDPHAPAFTQLIPMPPPHRTTRGIDIPPSKPTD